LRPAPFLLIAVLVFGCGGPSQPVPEDSKTQGQVQWEHIKTWSGKGSQYLDSFPAEGALRIEWEATPAADAATPGAIKILVHSAISGRPLAAPIVDHPGEGKGVAYFSEEPRVFFLNVESQDLDWKVSVSERVR